MQAKNITVDIETRCRIFNTFSSMEDVPYSSEKIAEVTMLLLNMPFLTIDVVHLDEFGFVINMFDTESVFFHMSTGGLNDESFDNAIKFFHDYNFKGTLCKPDKTNARTMTKFVRSDDKETLLRFSYVKLTSLQPSDQVYFAR